MCKNFKTFPSLLSYSPALSTLFGLFNPRPSHRLSLSSPLFTTSNHGSSSDCGAHPRDGDSGGD